MVTFGTWVYARLFVDLLHPERKYWVIARVLGGRFIDEIPALRGRITMMKSPIGAEFPQHSTGSKLGLDAILANRSGKTEPLDF